MYTGGNVTVMVSDFERAVRFYAETLGLKLLMRAGDGWAQLAAPGLTIGLHAPGPHGPRPGPSGGTSIGLQVDDLDSAMAALRERGVAFGDVTPGQGIRLAFFTDPDQTALYLWENKAPAGH
jgi:catechol 2,3-dioxygenase-like lactoylglutathione lyase family enzyme